MCSSSYQALNSSSMAGGGSVIVSSSPLLDIGDPSFLESIGTIGDALREGAALLGELDRDPGRHHAEDRPRDLLDHQRRQAFRGLVEQDGAGIAGQAARDAQHLLLAAGKRSGA